MQVLVVDAANVMGSRPDGWWRDRAGAASRLHDQLASARLAYDEVVLVLEGAARSGRPEGVEGQVRTVHAPRSGDDAVVSAAAARVEAGDEVAVVTADRALRNRVEAVGARCMGPAWLLGRL
jgi:hypothetical protein